jgi:hypothetical protein
MAFIASNCKIMHTGSNNPCYSYKMSIQSLGVTDKERDIGGMVTKILRQSAQCTKAVSTASLVLKQLDRAFHFRYRYVFVRLYTQYMRPNLEFAMPAWSPWTDEDKKCPERVQEKVIGMVLART